MEKLYLSHDTLKKVIRQRYVRQGTQQLLFLCGKMEGKGETLDVKSEFCVPLHITVCMHYVSQEPGASGPPGLSFWPLRYNFHALLLALLPLVLLTIVMSTAEGCWERNEALGVEEVHP